MRHPRILQWLFPKFVITFYVFSWKYENVKKKRVFEYGKNIMRICLPCERFCLYVVILVNGFLADESVHLFGSQVQVSGLFGPN